MMFNHLAETFRFADFSTVAVGGSERPGGNLEVSGADSLAEFRMEMGLPVWRYEAHGHVLEKRRVHAPPPQHRPRHVPPGVRATAPSASSSARRSTSAATTTR